MLKQIISSLRFRSEAKQAERDGVAFIRVDASSACQLKCPLCPTSRGENREGVVGWGYLRFESLRKLLDENPAIKKVELSNWGEIFLNPQIKDILRLGHERGIEMVASNGSNLNTLDAEKAEALVKYGFRFLSVSLDGASQETYCQYRASGNFGKVIENIRLINQYKEQYGSELPRLRWQFIVFGHNEHEIEKARRMAEELGMEFYPKLNYDNDYSPVSDPEAVKKASGLKYVSRKEYRERRKKEYALPCKQFWFSPQVNWDGKLLGCCMNTFSDYGNVFETGLSECMQSERYRYTKDLLLGKVPPRDDIPCLKCSIYISASGPVARMF